MNAIPDGPTEDESRNLEVTTISRTRGEDVPTTEWIWHEFGSELQGFVRRRIADPDRADDIVSDILLRVHSNLHQVADQERVASWLFRIARNAVIDAYRRAGRDREQSQASPGEIPDEQAEFWDSDQSGVLAELAGCLRPLLHGLPADQRRAVQLADLDGMAQVDAAALEGISVSGMKSRVQRGRRRLAELLGQCCALTLDGRGLPMDYTAPADCGGCTQSAPNPAHAAV